MSSDAVRWIKSRLLHLRRFLPYPHGVPCGRWLNILMNRIDPGLISDCFMAWACSLRGDAPDLIALDGKTSRRSHDRSAGKAALHLVSALATTEKLVLGQEAVEEKSNEIKTIPLLLERLARSGTLTGAPVTIDAIACNPKIAQTIVTLGADYLLAVKDNQPGLHDEVKRVFDEAPAESLEADVQCDKGHGRIEQRRCRVSHAVDWLTGSRRFPGEYCFPKIATLIELEACVEHKSLCTRERQYHILSRALSATQAAKAIRACWQIENAFH